MHSVRPHGRRRFRLGALAATAAASLLMGVVGPASPAQAADITDGLALWYKLDATSGTVAADASGNGRDGTVNGTASWAGAGEGLTFNGSDTYIKVPDNIMSGMNSITVAMDVRIDATQATPYFLYGFGNTTNGAGNGYLFSTGNSLRTAIAPGNFSTEQNTSTSAALPRSVWKHVTYTQTGTTGVLYQDGVEVARNTSVTITPGSLGSGTTTANYIGKSLYSSDKLFKGRIRDFRVYNRALAPGEVLEVSGNTTGIAKVTLPALKTDALIDDANSTITLPVKEGTDLTTLAPQFTLAQDASISPASGTPRDFTQPVTYEVTGSDGAKRTWTVTAQIMRSPVLPGLTADPNIVRFGDTYYIYPTTDGFAGWSGTKFKAYSSKDLVHWTDHGVILDLGPDVSWADGRAWAPAMTAKNGKYYFYYSADANIGVAVSDSPTGPFTDPLGKPLIASGAFTGQMIDPAVFTDDDGQSYLYWGNGRAYVVPLGDDMISFDASKVTDITTSGFREGSFVVKRNGTYYFMWSENDTRDENYRVAYATGSSPTGPWTKRSVILEKDLTLGIKGPGHHSVIQVPNTDDWYIVYHRFAIPGGDGTHRETTLDKMEFDSGGLIKKVVPTLSSVEPVTNGTSLPTNTTRSLRSVNFPGRYAVVRSDSLGYLDPVTSSSTTAVKQSATFTVIPGLADANCYSFRDSSGRYLRHKDFRVRFDAGNGTTLFNKDATYCARPGSTSGSVSLESYNYPGRYLRHYNYELRIDAYQDTATFRADSSFTAVSPLT
ncbi:family 43 glycosylhydrolase [Streptomyces sp. ND05-3B]|nr:family 43 glycosylhydrolase [Streptomyces caniscabiei]MBE4760862.1 family 43 glycosylhydrolase [Streptomyces caniscabiei]MBE4774845.1 family 43 glycosylhydrolase [Streptomyces caniscabiei]MBE4789604.1 family 43 glycosylhydrolase [Streptomyces caniscabiei]MBE4798727.1 family 43 glycosylhydrolase [Streptomyces caniscabiei]